MYEFRGGGDYLAAERNFLPHCKREKICYTSDIKHHFKSIKNGFTLAEVLITLGVIGVVAAMTLPLVINNIQKKDYSVRLKRFHSMFNQAVRFSVVDNGEVSGWNNQVLYHDSEDLYRWFEELISPYMVTVKNCREGKSSCVAEYKICNLKTGICRTPDEITKSSILYVFPDGTLMTAVTGGNYDSDTGFTNGGIGLEIAYDVNGYKKPNVVGKDIFYFTFLFNEKDENFLVCTGFVDKSLSVNSNTSRDILLDSCKIQPSTCGCLLMSDNFEFKNDYPW